MSEKNPKPGPTGSEIPTGRLAGKGEKPTVAAKPKMKPIDVSPLAPPTGAHALPPAIPSMPVGEFDVELVAVPCPPAVMPRKPRDQRSLVELDRRDFIMMRSHLTSLKRRKRIN